MLKTRCQGGFCLLIWRVTLRLKKERKRVMGKETINAEVNHGKLSMVERRRKRYNELKYKLKYVWTTEMESSTE